MDYNIVLKGTDGDLELEVVNGDGWTRCYLTAESRLLLGADSFACVAAGLSRALQDCEADTTPPAGLINGVPVWYAVHLEEAHHSLYYGNAADTRLLFWQADARAPVNLVGVIRLSPEQRRQWVETLTQTVATTRRPVGAAL